MINTFPCIQSDANDKQVGSELGGKQEMHDFVHPTKQTMTCRILAPARGKKTWAQSAKSRDF